MSSHTNKIDVEYCHVSDKYIYLYVYMVPLREMIGWDEKGGRPHAVTG